MDDPEFKLVITFDTDKGQVSGELLDDLAAIMSQYGLKPATLDVHVNHDVHMPSRLQPTLVKDEKTHEPGVLRFPTERIKRPDDSDPV